MSSGGKGGAASQSKNWYGTLIGAVGWGPWDWITAVVHNGNYIFQGNLALTTDVTDLTASLLDPSLIAPGGSLKIYRGTETQPADSRGTRDKGTVKIEARRIFFGQDAGSAPNLQVIGGGLPRVPTSVVAAPDNVADDGQVNPVAAVAEFLLDERGCGMDVSELDLPSWLAAAHWCAQDQEHKDFTFCSPYVAEQRAVRDSVRQLLEPFNGFLRRTKTGKLGCFIYEWGVDPGGLPILDYRHWTRVPRILDADWDDVKTEVVTKFTDRDFEYQDNAHAVPNAVAYQIRQVDDPGSLDRPHVTRIAQIHKQTVEFTRRLRPTPSVIKVRQPFIEALLVGDKIKIDSDPEPGGAGLAQLVRIERIEQNRSDEATLEVMPDNLVPATVYTPVWTPPTVVDEVSPPLVNFIGVPLPPNAWGWPAAVALFATRPDAKIVGFEAYFSTAHAAAYADLGQQPGFAVRASLQANISAVAAVAPFTELDGLNAPDAGLASNTPGGNATEAGDNILLALIASLDGNGRIALAADGDPVMEFVSIVDRATGGGLPADTFNYSILRGRLGTKAQAWGAGAVVWIVPRANIVPWRHSLLSSMLGGVAYFRLVSFTPAATDDTIPVPECSVNMLPATAPMYGGVIDGTTGPDDGVAPNPVSGATVTPGLSLLVLKWSNPTNTPLKQLFIYEATTAVKPAAPSFVVDAAQTFFFRTGLPASAHRYFWIEVQAVNGRRAIAGPFDDTTRAGIDLSDFLPGQETVGIVAALPTPAGYTGPNLVILTTDRKLYRYNPAVPAWTRAVDGGDLIANSIIAGALAAGAVTATAVGANLIITTTANIGAAVITDANIASLTAAKILSGVLDTMTLQAAKTASDSAVYNRGYGTGSTMPVTGYQSNDAAPNFNVNGTQRQSLLTIYGWATGSGYADNRFAKSDVVFVGTFHSSFSLPGTGNFADVYGVYRVNGGSWVRMAPGSRNNFYSGGGAVTAGQARITGLNGTDVVEIGVEVVTPSSLLWLYGRADASWGNL